MAGTYEDIGTLIKNFSPYAVEAKSDLPDLDGTKPVLEARGIQFAGWLQDFEPNAPIVSSDNEMTIDERRQCFYWDFRFPDKPDENAPRPTAKVKTGRNGGDVYALQITKVIRIPYKYTREDGEVLNAHIVIGYEGAASP